MAHEYVISLGSISVARIRSNKSSANFQSPVDSQDLIAAVRVITLGSYSNNPFVGVVLVFLLLITLFQQR